MTERIWKTTKSLVVLPVFILSVCTYSCVERFWPEVTRYDNLLVVDGLLTNGNDPVIVKLATSSPINENVLNPLSGGELHITDENLTETPFIETEPGTYQVMDSSFRGKIGSDYKLHIYLADGRNYESDICHLSPPSPIDSVYGVIESFDIQNSIRRLWGMQFYINNHSVTGDTCYYQWRLSQTYKYKSSLNIDYTWEGEFIPYPKPDSLRTCWKSEQINQIYTYSTAHIDPPVIKQFPLIFVTTKTRELSIRYSLLVKQLSISGDAFNFWDALRQQNIEQGNLYSQQPIQIIGNIHNVNDLGEAILGYFTVAGITEQRIYVNRPAVIPYYYSICDPYKDVVLDIMWISPEFWPVYITDDPDTGLAGGAHKACFDCRLRGGTITQPDFWVN